MKRTFVLVLVIAAGLVGFLAGNYYQQHKAAAQLDKAANIDYLSQLFLGAFMNKRFIMRLDCSDINRVRASSIEHLEQNTHAILSHMRACVRIYPSEDLSRYKKDAEGLEHWSNKEGLGVVNADAKEMLEVINAGQSH